MNFNDIIGKQILDFVLNSESDRFTLNFTDGTSRSYGVEGDCCSQSWIEHLETPDDISGAKILSVEDGGGVSWDDHECVGEDWENPYSANPKACGHHVLSVYNTRFNTDKGTIVLEYRNDSNGYYGGYLVD